VSWRRGVTGSIAVVLLGLALLAVTVPIGGAAGGPATTMADRPAATGLVQQNGSTGTATPENDSIVRHRNPAQVDEGRNLSDVENWLSGRMRETLVDCSEGIEVGSYDACEELNGEYPDWLDQYVDVARETEGTDDDNASESFERAGKRQRRYVNHTETFNETLSSYREARRNGETERARELARRLRRTANRINETGANLTRNYRTIGNATRVDTRAAINTTTAITGNVTETVATIEREQFRNTTVVARAPAAQLSFLDPLRVIGRVTTANGSGLAFTRVRLVAGNRTLETRTDSRGAFAFTYRPTLLDLDTRRIAVRHAPENASLYLGNETTLPVDAEQVEPTIDTTVRPAEAGFGDRVTVEGRVGARGTPAGSVPVAVSVGGRRLGTVRTGPEGRFAGTVRLPTGVPAGNRTVAASLPLEGRALAGVETTARLTVVRTPTALAVRGAAVNDSELNGSRLGGASNGSLPNANARNGSAANESTASATGSGDRPANASAVRVAGRLTTANGTPVGGQRVALWLDGTAVGEARTGPNGSYATTVAVPRSVIADRSGTVALALVAVYDEAGTNLGASRASTRVDLVLPAAERSLLDRLAYAIGTLPPAARFALGSGTMAVALVVAYWLRRRLRSDRSPEPSGDAPGGTDAAEGERGEPRLSALLDAADEQLAGGDAERAIATAYAAARARLGGELGLDAALTHWEFLTACRSRELDGGRLDALRGLTEAYEQAAFAPWSPSPEAATEAIGTARRFGDEIGDDGREQGEGTTAD
jgi:hypothetical protein